MPRYYCIVLIVCSFFSCGNPKNFNVKKYTDLKSLSFSKSKNYFNDSSSCAVQQISIIEETILDSKMVSSALGSEFFDDPIDIIQDTSNNEKCDTLYPKVGQPIICKVIFNDNEHITYTNCPPDDSSFKIKNNEILRSTSPKSDKKNAVLSETGLYLLYAFIFLCFGGAGTTALVILMFGSPGLIALLVGLLTAVLFGFAFYFLIKTLISNRKERFSRPNSKSRIGGIFAIVGAWILIFPTTSSFFFALIAAIFEGFDLW